MPSSTSDGRCGSTTPGTTCPRHIRSGRRREMCDLCDAWHAVPDSELPPPLKSYDPDYAEKLHTPRSLNNVEYGADVFARHALTPAIMRAVLALGPRPEQAASVPARD